MFVLVDSFQGFDSAGIYNLGNVHNLVKANLNIVQVYMENRINETKFKGIAIYYHRILNTPRNQHF